MVPFLIPQESMVGVGGGRVGHCSCPWIWASLNFLPSGNIFQYCCSTWETVWKTNPPVSSTQRYAPKVLLFRGPDPPLHLETSYEAESDSSLLGSCEAQKHHGILNETTFSKVPSNQGFPYPPKTPFLATT